MEEKRNEITVTLELQREIAQKLTVTRLSLLLHPCLCYNAKLPKS